MYKSKWQYADQNPDTKMSQLDTMHYNLKRNKRGLPVDAPYADDGVSNSTIKMAELSTREDYETRLKPDTLNKLSSERRDYLTNVLAQTRTAAPMADLTPQLISRGNGGQGLRKQAISGTEGLSHSSNTTHLAPDFYSPLWLGLNMQMPRDIRTANAWNRAYYETNPYVRNAINLHATYPISKLKIKCEDKKVEKFFLDMMDRIDLDTVVQQVSLEYWKMGEVFAYADFDEQRGEWGKVYIHNPDYIVVKSSPIPGVSFIGLQPDPQLAKIINSNDPANARIREALDPRIIEHVRKNEFIPLDNFNVSHLKNLSAPYDVRGTSVIVSVWKDLMLYDKIRESKLVQADGMINPMTHVKIGASNPDGHYPTQSELETYRNVLESAQFDKDFKLITHDAVAIERIGYNGAVMDTSADVQFLIDNVLMGLMVPKSILTQEGATYASASVALDVMRQRYNNFRTMMANWLEKKIFAPIAEIQGFYKPENGIKRLIVPTVEWNHMTLYDLDNYLGHILGLVEKQHVSVETVYRSLGLNKEEEMGNVRAEQVKAAILRRENEELSKMSLSELRALDPTKPVPERPRDALPGQIPGAQPPGGGGGGGGMGDLLGGGMGGGPPMPDMGGGMPGGDLGGAPPPLDMGGMPGGADLGPGGPGGDLTTPPPMG